MISGVGTGIGEGAPLLCLIRQVVGIAGECFHALPVSDPSYRLGNVGVVLVVVIIGGVFTAWRGHAS